MSLSNGPYLKDTGGAKTWHLARNTSSKIVSKSISANGGINIYRGMVRVVKGGAVNSTAAVSCDSLILDEESKAYTYPHNQSDEPGASIIHEATTGKLGEDKLFYMNQRGGISEEEAKSLIVIGFISEVLEGLPFEYVQVLKKVIELEFSEVGGCRMMFGVTQELLERLEYQKYGDSPTIKSYTKWKLFEENSPLRLPTEAEPGEVPVKGNVLLSGSGGAEFSFQLELSWTRGRWASLSRGSRGYSASTSTPSRKPTGSGSPGTSLSRS